MLQGRASRYCRSKKHTSPRHVPVCDTHQYQVLHRSHHSPLSSSRLRGVRTLLRHQDRCTSTLGRGKWNARRLTRMSRARSPKTTAMAGSVAWSTLAHILNAPYPSTLMWHHTQLWKNGREAIGHGQYESRMQRETRNCCYLPTGADSLQEATGSGLAQRSLYV